MFEEISVMAEEETVRSTHRFSDLANSQIVDIADAAQRNITKDATIVEIGVILS